MTARPPLTPAGAVIFLMSKKMKSRARRSAAAAAAARDLDFVTNSTIFSELWLAAARGHPDTGCIFWY